MLNKQHLIFSLFLSKEGDCECVCAKMCVSECVCAAFLPSLKAWKHNYALTQRHRPAFHMTHRAPVFGHKSTAAGVEVALHNKYASNRQLGPATALSCSEVFLSSWFTVCKAFCVCMRLRCLNGTRWIVLLLLLFTFVLSALLEVLKKH